jgi:hypothetical protein
MPVSAGTTGGGAPRQIARCSVEGSAKGRHHVVEARSDADIQSLADMGNSFRFVVEMRNVPFGRRAVLELALAAAIPCVPLLLLVVPVSEIFAVLKRVVV